MYPFEASSNALTYVEVNSTNVPRNYSISGSQVFCVRAQSTAVWKIWASSYVSILPSKHAKMAAKIQGSFFDRWRSSPTRFVRSKKTSQHCPRTPRVGWPLCKLHSTSRNSHGTDNQGHQFSDSAFSCQIWDDSRTLATAFVTQSFTCLSSSTIASRSKLMGMSRSTMSSHVSLKVACQVSFLSLLFQFLVKNRYRHQALVPIPHRTRALLLLQKDQRVSQQVLTPFSHLGSLIREMVYQ